MRIRLLVVLPCLVMLSAQSQKTFSTASLQLTFPQGEYRSTSSEAGIGVRWNVMHKFSDNSPLSIGGEIGYLVISSTSRYFDLYYQGFFDRYKVAASSNVVTLAFKARADLTQPEQKTIVFVDATIGTNLFFSSVDITAESSFGGSQNAGGNSSKGYWAFLFGPGAGVEIPLGKSREVNLVLKTSFLFGTTSKYLTDPYIDNGGDVYFLQRESRTDLIVAEAGVRFNIGRRR